MGVTSFLLLSCLGLAITVQAQNCSKPVGGSNMGLSDKDILSETFPSGTKVSFTCDVGYQSAGGSSSITCTDGSWSPVRLICERKNCGSAGEVANGHIDYSEGTEFGDKVVIICNPGYILVGKKEITCGAQGWMDRLPVCEVVTCDSPPTVADGTFSPEKETFEYGEVVRYTCQKDLTLVGSNSLTCSDDRTFQPGPPTCTMVECADPDIVNADWTGGSRPPYRYKDTVTYQCRSGYTMIGARTLTCAINSQWSPGLPTCQRLSTTTKATTTTTTATTTTTTTKKPQTTSDPSGPPPIPDPTSPSGNGGISLGEGIGIACGILGCGIAVLIFMYIKKRIRRDHDKVATNDAGTELS